MNSQTPILSGTSPVAGACGAEISAPSADATEVGVYVCAFTTEEAVTEDDPTEPSVAPSPTPGVAPSNLPSPAPALPTRAELANLFGRLPGSLSAGLTTRNDNYPGRLQQKSADDLKFDSNHTFDFNLNVVKVFGRDTKLGKRGDAVGFEVGTNFFAQPDGITWDTYRGVLAAQETQIQTGLPVTIRGADGRERSVYLNSVKYTGLDPNESRQQTLDRQYLTVFKEWNREKFTIVGEVTAERRDSDGKSFGNKFQNGWHRMGGANYTFVDLNANGQSGAIHTTPATNASIVGATAEIVDATVDPDFKRNEAIKSYGSWASNVAGTVKKTKQIFRGNCELQASLRVQAGVFGDGGKVAYDPNSHVRAGADFGIPIGKRNKFSFSTGAALVYFPKPSSGSNFDWNANAGVKGNFYTGKKKANFIQTEIRFAGPGIGGALSRARRPRSDGRAYRSLRISR